MSELKVGDAVWTPNGRTATISKAADRGAATFYGVLIDGVVHNIYGEPDEWWRGDLLTKRG